MALISSFFRTMLRREEGQVVPITGAGNGAIAKALTLIEKQLYAGFPGVNELAFVCNMSVPSLHRKFKEAFQETPLAYFHSRQMMLADDLLAKGIPVQEVAFQLGFPNQSNFSRLFKKLRGTKPTLAKKALVPYAGN
jgi:AraC-like DNA-binding protein